MAAHRDPARLCLVIVGHGSREGKANLEFEGFVRSFALSYPQYEVHFSYTELADPDTKTRLKQLCLTHSRILLVPLFLFTSGHVKNDIPLIVNELRLEFPNTQIFATQTLGVNMRVIQLLRNRVAQLPGENREAQKRSGVIVVNRGSSDVDANSDFHKVVRVFEEGNQYSFVLPSFIGITTPLLEQSLEMAAKWRPDRLIIAPYFLFNGRLIQKIGRLAAEFAERYPWIKTEVADHFGPDPSLFEVLHERIQDALAGKGVLPCSTCEYRQQLPGLSNKVGGLKALLWSLRHMETHNQAVPHEYPHRNLKKHILVCENVDCAGRGSGILIRDLRAQIKEAGRQADFKVTRTSCMGRCGEGPVVVVYPDGIWYQKVQPSDVPELVKGHLFADRIVAKLVDNIMQ